MTIRDSNLVYILRYKRRIVYCACGCGGTLPKFRMKKHLKLIYGKYPRFLPGHSRKKVDS